MDGLVAALFLKCKPEDGAIQDFLAGQAQSRFSYAPVGASASGFAPVILIRHFGFWLLNAARIVYVTEERSGSIRRYGFAYGTLLDHGESGEERFLVEWDQQGDSVWYDLFGFSHPRAVAAGLGYRLARWLQSRLRRDFKTAMFTAVV